jgi:hypothetical protein
MIRKIIQISIIINGIYDILCSLCILKIISIPILNELHLSMYKNKLDDQEKRLLAYWIFTYGIARLTCGINLKYKICSYIAMNSYIVELVATINESIVHNKMHKNRALFVILFSSLFALSIYIS